MRSVLWLTNIPTPYRLPVWTQLSSQLDFHVAVMRESEPNRHWDGAALVIASSALVLGAPRLRLGSDTFLYGPNRRLVSALLRRPFDCLVIDGWESPAYVLAMSLARRRGSAVVLSYRGTSESHQFTRGPVARARRAMFKSADAVLTGGPGSSAAVRHMGVDPARIVEGLNVVDVANLAEQALELRDLTSAGHRFLVVGQLIERKNVAGVIRAFAEVRSSSDTLTVVGDGPERAALEALATSLEVHAVFTGHLGGAALTMRYAQADTMVLGSTREVYGLVVPEALACGSHAVVSSQAGCAEDLSGMRGVFVAEPQVAALAEAMRRSVSEWRGPVQDPEILHRSPAHAAQRVVVAVEVALATRRGPRHDLTQS